MAAKCFAASQASGQSHNEPIAALNVLIFLTKMSRLFSSSLVKSIKFVLFFVFIFVWLLAHDSSWPWLVSSFRSILKLFSWRIFIKIQRNAFEDLVRASLRLVTIKISLLNFGNFLMNFSIPPPDNTIRATPMIRRTNLLNSAVEYIRGNIFWFLILTQTPRLARALWRQRLYRRNGGTARCRARDVDVPLPAAPGMIHTGTEIARCGW